ncbi:MAG: hypothetical protein N2314_09240 [Brevinematales bacterium]|nr:hypothetical protein [Brevinematales bacterium]
MISSGITPLVCENDFLRLVALPQLGGKVISFFLKPLGKELLFQPQTPYRPAKVGSSFAEYDTSGWDEMLPTIDPCCWRGRYFPDHGEVWARAWEMEVEGNILRGRVRCETLPLLFEREISLEENLCRVSYLLTNLSDEGVPYLWAWHALWDMKDLSLDIPGIEEVIPVHAETFLGEKDIPVSWPVCQGHDLRKPFVWKGEKTAKIYLPPHVRCSSAFLRWPGVCLAISWRSEYLPYLGIWYNHGGFKGEYNLAIEPATGYYDRLDEAYERGMISSLPARGTTSWTLALEIRMTCDRQRERKAERIP